MAHFEKNTLARPEYFNFATDVVDYWANKFPGAQAMHWVSGDFKQTRELTFSHFKAESHRIAVLLQSLGVEPGQRLLIISPRLPEWWEIAVACIRSSIVLCPATTLLVEKDIQFRCQMTKATVFVGDSKSVQRFQNIRHQCPFIKVVIQVGDDGCDSGGEVIKLHEAINTVDGNAKFSPRITKGDDPALIYFTSGTSGPPKMVLHSHISYPLAHTITGKHWLKLSPGKIYWNLSEQGWGKAAWSLFGAWNCGASLFIHDDRRPFSPARVLQVLHSYPITTLCAPPTVYRHLVLEDSRAFITRMPPQTLSHCTSAGEPLNDEVIRVWQKMTGVKIKDGYGQTETTLLCGNFDNAPVKSGSMGRPLPGVPLAIIDSNGEECLPGQEGAIGILMNKETAIVHQKTSFFGIYSGYIEEDGSLSQKIHTIGNNSWYLTGDRATRDNDGYFWFVGRSDDVINSSGYRIGPFEVESVLKLHPGVIESAAVASPDVLRSEVVKAFVVLTPQYAQRAKNNAEEIVKDLQDFCKENSAPYKYPRKIQIVDAAFLPKTISGKIRRNELKAMEWRGYETKHKGQTQEFAVKNGVGSELSSEQGEKWLKEDSWISVLFHRLLICCGKR